MVLGFSIFFDLLTKGWLGNPPTLWQAIGLWIAVTLAGIVLSVGFGAICRFARIHPRGLVISELYYFRWTKPSLLYEKFVPGASDLHARYGIEVWQLDDLLGRWDVAGIMAVDSAAEELVFRGVPLVLAIAAGQPPVFSVVLGTVLWASLHDIRHFPSHLIKGVFFAWLWLTGAWLLAIGIHVVNNLIAHVYLRLKWWNRRGRYRTTDQIR